MKKQTEKKKRKKLPKKKLLEKECFELWSKCVIARDITCRASGGDSHLSAHHIRSRSHHSVRFDIDNGLTLSWKVHFLQKANPERFMDIIIGVIGNEKYEALKRKSLVVVDQTTGDLEYQKEYLIKKLEMIKAGIDFTELPL
jgi:hypothetical protein